VAAGFGGVTDILSSIRTSHLLFLAIVVFLIFGAGPGSIAPLCFEHLVVCWSLEKTDGASAFISIRSLAFNRWSLLVWVLEGRESDYVRVFISIWPLAFDGYTLLVGCWGSEKVKTC